MGTTILILLVIGLLIAAFTISGVVPTIVYYGLNFITAEMLLPLTFLLTAVVSLALGSS
jgi:NhaC family Na+:H+ antiporter